MTVGLQNILFSVGCKQYSIVLGEKTSPWSPEEKESFEILRKEFQKNVSWILLYDYAIHWLKKDFGIVKETS